MPYLGEWRFVQFSRKSHTTEEKAVDFIMDRELGREHKKPRVSKGVLGHWPRFGLGKMRGGFLFLRCVWRAEVYADLKSSPVTKPASSSHHKI